MTFEPASLQQVAQKKIHFVVAIKKTAVRPRFLPSVKTIKRWFILVLSQHETA